MDILENSAQITMLLVGLAVIASFILVKVFYLLTLQKTLEQVASERREMFRAGLVRVNTSVWYCMSVL